LPRLRWDEVAKLASIGCIQGFEIGCNNKSLEYLSVSARTMLGSTHVVFIMVTARFWGLEQLSVTRLIAALFVVIGGVMQGLDVGERKADAEVSAYMSGILLLGLSMLAAAHRWALVQHVTQREDTGSALNVMSKSKLHLVQYTSPFIALVCLLLSLRFEKSDRAIDSVFDVPLVIGVLGCALGIVVLTVAELEIVRVTSAVALSFLGTLHNIPIVMAGMLLLNEKVRAWRLLGFVFCVFGGICYGRARHSELQRKTVVPQRPPADFTVVEECG